MAPPVAQLRNADGDVVVEVNVPAEQVVFYDTDNEEE